jgi:hypothetical protein
MSHKKAQKMGHKEVQKSHKEEKRERFFSFELFVLFCG